jgi:hypothetical protein
LHGTKWSDGENKRWKLPSSKNNSTEDSVGNEENGYPVPDLNKTMINVAKEPNDAYKKIPQRRNHRETHGEDTRHS